MKSKANSDPATQNPNASAQPPSVPISVYRELAAELQATRAMLESVHTKNQQLSHQNQLFQQEAQRVVQAVMNLQYLIEPVASHSTPHVEEFEDFEDIEEDNSAAEVAAQLRPEPLNLDEQFTEIDPDLPVEQTQRPRALGGLWLTMVVVAIVITAFGAGFLIVRPLLPSR